MKVSGLNNRNSPERAAAPANLQYPRFVQANKQMRAINNNVQKLRDLRSLESVQAYAIEVGRMHDYTAQIGVMYRSQAWKNTGALKRKLLDMWGEARTTFAKRTMEQYRADTQ